MDVKAYPCPKCGGSVSVILFDAEPKKLVGVGCDNCRLLSKPIKIDNENDIPQLYLAACVSVARWNSMFK